MLRIPSSHNSKCVLRNNGIADSSTEVKIVQRSDGKRPAINWLLCDFRRCLIQEKINTSFEFKSMKLRRRGSSDGYYPTSDTIRTNIHPSKWPWVETLLSIPIADSRKFAVWRILAPYFVNVRKMSNEDAFHIIKDWLQRCSSVRSLDFREDQMVGYNLRRAAGTGYLPISLNKLKEQNPELHGLLSRGG